MNAKQIAKAAIIILLLALIRCIGEFFRLQYLHKNELTIAMGHPFVIGAMVCAVSCLLMNLLFFYSRFRWVIALAVVTIIILFFLKFSYRMS
jgi:hypothetical protein